MRCAWLAPLVFLIGGCVAGGSGDWPLHAELFPAQRMPMPATRAGQVITIGTYNLHQQRNAAGLREDFQRIDADAWLFEEVRITDRGIDELRALLPSPNAWNIALVRVNPMPDANGDTEAQMIVTRLPIDRAEVWPLPSSQRRRCALAVRSRVGGHEVLLVDTDHEPGYFAFSIAHEPQLRALVDRLSNRAEPMIIIGGDFNTCGNFWRLRSSRSDAAVAQSLLSEKGFHPVIAAPTPTFFAGPVRGYLDLIFVRNAAVVEASVVNNAHGSDHRPVVARLSFNQP